MVGSRLRFDPETVSALFREQAKRINGARKGVDVDLEEGEILLCESCGVELEVISGDPLELALAPEEEEDWGE